MELITSAANPRIKALSRLMGRREREQEGRLLIEGAREIERALQAGVELELLLVRDGPLHPDEEALHRTLTHGKGLRCLALAEAPLKKLSSRENPAGLIAVARLPRRSLEQLRLPPNPLVLIGVGLEKPGNLGAVLRCADAAGAHAVIAVGGVDLYGPQVIRNSTGVVFSLPTVAASEGEVLDWLKARGLTLVAATPHAKRLYWDVDLRGPVAIAVGPEHQGLGPQWLEAAQLAVRIPMQGQADSLNVSVSAALLLYEALRQRWGSGM
ncbi:TrmH family RNA methyltransferase [Calidithermus timidus]|jgi:TrmH family RNA methyltransferase|uniref:TrmH family RNA methyltransferase n=1 Tax=Calidithermus timidus TaxID=307124 RepID=UPI0003656343|nr:RNA methyltransferase [Calidithermus timidus]